MNEFGTPRLEAFVPKAKRKSGREEVESAVEDIQRSANVRPEDIARQLGEINEKLAKLSTFSPEEVHELQIRKTALLEYRHRVDPQYMNYAVSVDDAPDIPTLSEDLEQKYPVFGTSRPRRVANQTFVFEPKDAHDGKTIPFIRPVEDDQEQAAK